MDQRNCITYLTLAIRKSFPCEFGTEAAGLMYVERDTGLPPFKQEIGLVTALGAGIQEKLGLQEQVRARVRKVQTDPKEAHMVVRLCGPELTQAQMGAVKSMAVQFAQTVCPNSQPSLLDDPLPVGEARDCTQAAADSAHIFLQSNGGRRVSHPAQLAVGDQVVGDFAGVWHAAPPEESRIEPHKETVFYNGRALREHVVHFVKTNSNGTRFDVAYDEERFDAFFRSLEDDKHAALEVEYECEHVGVAKKPRRITLLTARLVALPDKFQRPE
jgi:hypothetical protein